MPSLKEKVEASPIAAVLPELAIAGVSAITKGGPRRQYKWNKRAAADANAMNRENAEWMIQQNKELQREQREYDSPASQMSRYLAAGLNPHLIYGSGSSAGNAFPTQAPQMPASRLDAPSAAYPDVAGSFIGAQMAQSQMGLQAAKTSESAAKRQLLVIQDEIARTNPMLRPEVAASVADSMDQIAQLKADSAYYLNQVPSGETLTRGRKKVDMDIEQMAQRIGLNTADLAIKNKIFESKEFENAVKEIQSNWLKDGDVTPEHIRQGVMLLLSKMLGR